MKLGAFRLENLRQEELGAFFSGVGEEVLGLTDFDDLAVGHEDDPVGWVGQTSAQYQKSIGFNSSSKPNAT